MKGFGSTPMLGSDLASLSFGSTMSGFCAMSGNPIGIGNKAGGIVDFSSSSKGLKAAFQGLPGVSNDATVPM